MENQINQKTSLNMISQLTFRRQFLLSAIQSDKFGDWSYQCVGNHHLYAHPDVGLYRAKQSDDYEIGLVGFLIDPFHPEKDSLKILQDLQHDHSTIEGLTKSLYTISGRYVLIIWLNKQLYILNDPCGLRSVFYKRFQGQLYAASQSLLLAEVIKLNRSVRFYSYFDSQFVKTHIEHWIPGYCTLYEDVFHLVPNHYLRSSDLQEIRFYPLDPLPKRSLEEGIEISSDFLRKSMIAANRHFDLALPVTCGLDSRTLLSASKDIADDLYFYTLQYRNMTLLSDDIRVPVQLFEKLGYQHHVLDCRARTPSFYREIYERNSDMAHFHDWGEISYGMLNTYPSEKLCVTGNCSETVQCIIHFLYGYRSDLRKEHIVGQMGWGELDFVVTQIDEWFRRAESEIHPSFKVLDMFFVENNMSCWQAQSQLEWDIVQDSFTPFSNRFLVDVMLGVDEKYRRKGFENQELYLGMIKKLWSKVLMEPINPSFKRYFDLS